MSCAIGSLLVSREASGADVDVQFQVTRSPKLLKPALALPSKQSVLPLACVSTSRHLTSSRRRTGKYTHSSRICTQRSQSSKLENGDTGSGKNLQPLPEHRALNHTLDT